MPCPPSRVFTVNTLRRMAAESTARALHSWHGQKECAETLGAQDFLTQQYYVIEKNIGSCNELNQI